MVIAVLSLITGGIISTISDIVDNYNTDKALREATCFMVERKMALLDKETERYDIDKLPPVIPNEDDENAFGNRIKKYDGEKTVSLKNKYGVFWTGKVKDINTVLSNRAYNSDIEIIVK